jgi:hypothetical protein
VLLAAILRTRPIYHSSDAAIRGHVFCSFLALMLRKELTHLCQRDGLTIEWADLLRDLDRLQEVTIAKDGKRISTRTAVAGQVGSVFAQIDRLAGEKNLCSRRQADHARPRTADRTRRSAFSLTLPSRRTPYCGIAVASAPDDFEDAGAARSSW